jgi:hypothetical protein
LIDGKEMDLHNILCDELVLRVDLHLFTGEQVIYSSGIQPTEVQFLEFHIVDLVIFLPEQDSKYQGSYYSRLRELLSCLVMVS